MEDENLLIAILPGSPNIGPGEDEGILLPYLDQIVAAAPPAEANIPVNIGVFG